MYVSGFSKILTPQWRVGFLAAAPALAERFIDTKLLTTLTTPAPLERALALCLDQGVLRRHAERVTARLQAARQRCVRLVQDSGCRLCAEALAQRLLDAGWLTAPGSLFHATRRPSTLMRVNFATSQDARFWQQLERQRTSANI